MSAKYNPSRMVSVLQLTDATTREVRQYWVTTWYGDVMKFNDVQRLDDLSRRERWQVVPYQTLAATIAKHPPKNGFADLDQTGSDIQRRSIQTWRQVAEQQAGFWKLASPQSRNWFAAIQKRNVASPGRLCWNLKLLNRLAASDVVIASDPLGWLSRQFFGRMTTLDAIEKFLNATLS